MEGDLIINMNKSVETCSTNEMKTTVHYTVLYCIQCIILYCIQCIVLYCTVFSALYSTVFSGLYCTALYSVHYTALYYIQCIILYCIQCIILYCTVFSALYCTVLYSAHYTYCTVFSAHASQPEKSIVGLRKRLKMVLQSRRNGPNRIIYLTKIYGSPMARLLKKIFITKYYQKL